MVNVEGLQKSNINNLLIVEQEIGHICYFYLVDSNETLILCYNPCLWIGNSILFTLGFSVSLEK